MDYTAHLFARPGGCAEAFVALADRVQNLLLSGPRGCGKYAVALAALARIEARGPAMPPGWKPVGRPRVRDMTLPLGPRAQLSLAASSVHVDFDAAAVPPHRHKAAIEALDKAFERDAARIVLIRRAHTLAEDAQQALRFVIERPGGRIRFWLTARPSEGRLIAPIASRLTPAHIAAPSASHLVGALVAGAPQPISNSTSTARFAPVPEAEATGVVRASGGKLDQMFLLLERRRVEAGTGGKKLAWTETARAALSTAMVAAINDVRKVGVPKEHSQERASDAVAKVVSAGLPPGEAIPIIVNVFFEVAGARLSAEKSARVCKLAFDLGLAIDRSETPVTDLVRLMLHISTQAAPPQPAAGDKK